MPQFETVNAFGDDTLSVTLTSKARRNALAKTLRKTGIWLEVVPGADGLTVQYDPLILSPADAKAALNTALADPVTPVDNQVKPLVIPICYAPDYALDMPHISALTGLPDAEIIARHTAARHCVDMIGFTPGFAYLECSDLSLDVPRLDRPRTYLPAGAIGLAGGQCGIYALAGPGGWPILGQTPLALFDTSLPDPFRLEPGQFVQFHAISKSEFEAWA